MLNIRSISVESGNNNNNKVKFHLRTGHEGPEGGRVIALPYI
jgi:hypothetical protein